MPEPLALRSLAVGLLMALPACHRGPVLTPAQIDTAARVCRTMLEDGRFDMHTMPSRVGFEPTRKTAGTPVVVYGASWCAACRAAAEYMDRRGIPFEERDVDDDAGARRERAHALSLAGLP
ncbi:MAG: glutaredoxin family protein, partial [Polyangiaceae bacterium]